MVYRDEEGNYRNAAGWKVSAPDDEPSDAEQDRSRGIAADINDGRAPGTIGGGGGSSDDGSSSGSDYPNPLAGDDPATGSDAGRDLGSSITDDERDRLQEQRRQEDRVDELDPTNPDSPGGTTVGSQETQRYLAAAREAGVPVRNLDERGALATQIERVTGVDARELARDRGGRDRADVSLDVEEGVFRTSWREELNQQSRRRQRQRASANDGLVGLGVASAANRGAFGFQQPSSRPLEGGDVRLLTESRGGGAIEGGDVRLFNIAQNTEQFGDVDWSEFLGTGSFDLEDVLRRESREFEQFATEQFGDVDARQQLVSDLSGGLLGGSGDPNDAFERSVAAQGRTLSGFNPADAGLGALEAAEATAWLGEPLTDGDVDEFLGRSEALGAAGLAAGVAAATSAQENPGRALETAGAIGAGGFLGGRALTGLPSAARTARVRAGASDRVDLAEITDERGVEGDLPNFETDPNAPTSQAVEEIRTRAADNPNDVTDVLGTNRALFQSTEADLGPEFSARRGSSELPGLFTSPDASPLRLSGSAASSGSFSPRFPRLGDLRTPKDRFAAFEGDRIEGFPDDATGSGRIPDGEGGFEPDPSTSGAQFLDESAEEGTAFVRPQGGRTTELEAIFPPGSTFRQTDSLAVDLPSGRSVPLDVFQRADGDDLFEGAGVDDIGGGLSGSSTADEIAASLRRSSRRSSRTDVDGDPFTPVGGASSTGAGASSSDLFDVSGFGSASSAAAASSGFGSGFGSGSVFGSDGTSFFGGSSTPAGTTSPTGGGTSVFGGGSTPFGSPGGSTPFGSPGGSSTPFGSPGGSPSTPSTPSTPGTPGTPGTPTGRTPTDFGSNQVREDSLFASAATEDLLDSGIQSGEELLEDFGFGSSSGASSGFALGDTSSSGSAFGGSGGSGGFGSGSGGDLFDEGGGWGF